MAQRSGLHAGLSRARAWEHERPISRFPAGLLETRVDGLLVYFPVLLTSGGVGAYTGQRLGVVGGDILFGSVILASRKRIYHEGSLLSEPQMSWHMFGVMPTLGWSGWRTLDSPSSLRANAFTGRLDIGYFNGVNRQGVTIFGAGRIGTGRGPGTNSTATPLYGAQVGIGTGGSCSSCSRISPTTSASGTTIFASRSPGTSPSCSNSCRDQSTNGINALRSGG